MTVQKQYFGAGIFFVSSALRGLFCRGLSSLAGTTMAASVLAYDIQENASNMRQNAISEATKYNGLRGMWYGGSST
jgi:hypothetical protein